MQKTIFNPIFNDTCTFVRTAAETNGEVSEMEVTLGSYGANPMHRHTAFTETFTVREGILGLVVNGAKVNLRAGQTLTVKRGEAHHFLNERYEPVRFNLTFSPGHTGAENMLRILYGMAQDGLTDTKGVPKNLVAIAVIGEMGDSKLTGMFSLLSPLFKFLAAYGRRQGMEKRLLEKYCSPQKSRVVQSLETVL